MLFDGGTALSLALLMLSQPRDGPDVALSLIAGVFALADFLQSLLTKIVRVRHTLPYRTTPFLVKIHLALRSAMPRTAANKYGSLL